MSQSTLQGMSPEQRQETWRRNSRRRAEAAFQCVPILVYTMGKVGSSTVYQSLCAAGFASRAFQVHYLCPEYIANQRKSLETAERQIPRTLHESEAIIQQLRVSAARPVKIISLIRDPLARAVSGLFENRYRARHVLKDDETFDVESTVNHLLTDMARPTPCEKFLTWFHEEPSRVFGIDILATPFDKERGWQIYRQGSAELLLLRLEDLSRIGSTVVTEFLGASEPIEMVKSHVRKEDTYPLVQQAFKAPRNVCEWLYATPLMRHLYTEDQLAEMIARWTIPDETPEQSEKRIRAAILSDLDARHNWSVREAEQLKADRAEARAMVEKLNHEVDRLRAMIGNAGHHTRHQKAA